MKIVQLLPVLDQNKFHTICVHTDKKWIKVIDDSIVKLVRQSLHSAMRSLTAVGGYYAPLLPLMRGKNAHVFSPHPLPKHKRPKSTFQFPSLKKFRAYIKSMAKVQRNAKKIPRKILRL